MAGGDVKLIEEMLEGPGGATIAHETLDLMRQHNIPVTSANYDVWLAYRFHPNDDLRKAIDDRIAEGQPFTKEFNAQIYDRHFTALRSSKQILAAGEKLARELSFVMEFLQAGQQKSGDYGRTLESAASNLGGGLEPDQVAKIVESLAAATLDMAKHNDTLSKQLHKASGEITTLRSSLESARVESLTDSLTGLANRRMFDETLRLRLVESRAQASEMCLLMCDIDHFKRFNDTWGHHTGDQILRFLATTLRSVARPDHLPARFGGEEFALVMPRTNLHTAIQIAESLRTSIQNKRLRRRSTNEDLGQVTVSIGIAILQPSDSQQTLLARADGCLYASKRNGRNQITTDSEQALFVA